MLTPEIIQGVIEAQDLGLSETEIITMCNKLCGFVGETAVTMLTPEILEAVELERKKKKAKGKK